MYSLHEADAWDALPALPAESVEAVVTDPPYGLGFMGKSWDKVDTPFRADFWREVMRVLKPGGHALVFGGSRTFHRMAVALEDAGFEYRDTITWLTGSGFPKNHDISKAIDKAAGAERKVVGHGQFADRGRRQDNAVYGQATPSTNEVITEPATDAARQWDGWGTALKPAAEYIALVRKPLSERNVAANVLAHGTGAINVDGCRVEAAGEKISFGVTKEKAQGATCYGKYQKRIGGEQNPKGRYPANVILTPERKQYRIKEDVKPEQLRKLADWLAENT